MIGHDHSHDDRHGPEHDHHADDDGHADRREGDRTRLKAALLVTLLICVAEVVGGYVSHSLALLSDAGHMFSDVVGEVLALTALIFAERPKDRRKTFGYYRIEILMALFQGAILFTLATGVIWQAALRLSAPAEVHTGVMLIVAAIGLLANIVCALLLRGGHSLNVQGAYIHVLLDGLSSVAVLAAGFLMWLRGGLYILDPLLSIAIGLFVYYSAFRLARDAVEVLLEAVPAGLDLDRIALGLSSVPGIKDIHDLHIWTITSGMHALSAHLVVDCDDVRGNDQLLTSVKEILAQRFRITHSTLQIESGTCAGRERVC